MAFAVLAFAGHTFDVVPFRWWFYAIIGFKLFTNTLTWLSLRLDKGVLEVSGLNVFADLLAFTAAIYFTGGVLSPLVAVYAIEIAVLGLLANLGVTVIAATLALALYGAMALLTHFEALPFVPPPSVAMGGATAGYIVVALLYAAVVVGVPTFFTGAIVKKMRDEERALDARTRDLVEAQRLRSQLMANVTHELRTPIQGVMVLADLVATEIYGPLTDKQRSALDGVKRSAKAQLALI